MRIAVVDIGTNSTRLLVADVRDGAVHERERRARVTRLGDGVDSSGKLDPAAIARVHETLDAYDELIRLHEPDAAVAVLTSAARDARDGDELVRSVGERHGLDARVIDGGEEARLTFLGATAGRAPDAPAPVLVADIGGGSTELAIGAPARIDFHVSAAAGVVRQSERHIAGDPPRADELRRLAGELRAIVAAAVPPARRAAPRAAIAVAGTPTSLAAIEQALDPYDPARVEGYELTLAACERQLARLASVDLPARREIAGLHPDRAPTIVAGVAILIEVLRAFGLDRATVSERDILHGAAIERARAGAGRASPA